MPGHEDLICQPVFMALPPAFRRRLHGVGGFPGGAVVKSLPANAGDAGDCGFDSWVRRSAGVGTVNLLKYSVSSFINNVSIVCRNDKSENRKCIFKSLENLPHGLMFLDM